MGVELTKNLVGEMQIDEKPVEYNVSNIIMDGDTTTISHIHECEREHWCVVRCGPRQESPIWPPDKTVQQS